MQSANGPTSDSYQDYLIDSLRKNPQLAADSITATLEEDDPESNTVRFKKRRLEVVATSTRPNRPVGCPYDEKGSAVRQASRKLE